MGHWFSVTFHLQRGRNDPSLAEIKCECSMKRDFGLHYVLDVIVLLQIKKKKINLKFNKKIPLAPLRGKNLCVYDT